MINFFISITACLFLLLGVVMLVSPIPVGVFIIAASLSVLVCVNATVRMWTKQLRSKYAWANNKIHHLESILENKFVYLWRVFLKTRPDAHTDSKDKN